MEQTIGSDSERQIISILITRRAEFHGLCPWVNVQFLNAVNMCIQMNFAKDAADGRNTSIQVKRSLT